MRNCNRVKAVVLVTSLIGLGLAGGWRAAGAAVGDVAPLAAVTASVNTEKAGAVTDGGIPAAGSRDDQEQTWVVGKGSLPATLTFTWPQPTSIATVVYYARATWGFEYFKNCEIYVDDAVEPVAKGTFQRGHGPQLVNLPQPVTARKLTVKFLGCEGNNPGASEVQIFSAPPSQEALLCRFSDFTMDLRYAYYPSHNLVRFLAPAPPADATEWQVAVRPHGGGKVIAERGGALPMSRTGESLKVPDLPDGHYTLTFTFAGGKEPVLEERGFQRHHYEWENQKLGMDDVVIPPFTPLEADAKKQTVACVLREHTHGDAGLWRQVTSQGRELLAGPVRLEVTSGGKTVAATGKVATFATIKPTQVAGTAKWQAGPLTGTTAFTYDYDGLMQLTLRLEPTEAQVGSLQLVIPLKESEAWLMHPVTNTLRHHYAGRIPKGQGKVWDSTSVPHRIGGSFVPYIFVGGPERGICFAADNDRDWVRGDGVPMMEIHRDGETVELRLNLIGKPTTLTRERTLTFALQATPAKPMPQEPYNWRRWWATPTARDADDVQIRFWGGNMYWGGRNFATSVYPDSKDYSFWEKLAESRRTGKRDMAYQEAWLSRFEDLPQDEYNNLRAHYNAGLSWAPGIPTITPETTKFNYIIPYTNPRGCSAEDRDFLTTYIDEWQTIDITAPNWPKINPFERVKRIDGFATWYHIEPAPTRIDMLLYYHKKMFETFADGIYWDNLFLRASSVPAEAGGPGYVDDDGNLRPGVNLMGFRNLVKRNAVMMHQMGKRPLSYIHMTNTNIVPMLSFGTLNLDWEWRDQGEWAKKDLQDRLGADQDTALILAQSMGLKNGNISIAIDRFNPPKDSGVTREWLFRTVMAVCLPHEIKVYQGSKEVSFVQNQLAALGYGQPECRVYRYWEADFPLKMTGANMYALALRNGPKALLAIGNYGPGNAPQRPAQTADGPSLEEYDAGQRKGPDDPGAVATEGTPVTHETYTVTLTLDLQVLGLPETVSAYDVERRQNQGEGAELKRLGPGVFEFTIRKHDFVLVGVE